MATCVLGEQSKIKTWNSSVIYIDYYLSLGFAYTCDDTVPDALCALCNKVLQHSSVLPAKLCRYCDTTHPAYSDKDISLSGISLRHYQNIRALWWRAQKLTMKTLLRPLTEWVTVLHLQEKCIQLQKP